MLEEQKLIDRIEIVENGTIQVREVTRILKDGELLASTFHRNSFPPGSDITSQPIHIQEISQIIWTSDVIDVYQNQISKGVEQ